MTEHASEHDLDRFLDAQEGTFEAARAEVAAGAKSSHWMWFIYPQLRGLGRSETAHYYGIADLDEATRYLTHPVLGPRLVEMFELMLTHSDHPPEGILGEVDGAKLRSSATLFASVPGAPEVFGKVLDTFYDGPCQRTRERIGA